MTNEIERQLRSTLHEELDSKAGPDPVWTQSPAARRAAQLDRDGGRRWPLRVLAVAAMIGAVGGATLLVGTLNRPPAVSMEAPNGWIAFTVAEGGDAADIDGDHDIWLVRLDREPRRSVGSATDRVDQLCPAFSPDGRRLAYGSVEGHGTRYSYSAPGDDRPAAYRNAALVVADVGDDGRVTDRLSVDVGDALPPPCPIWSPDGGRVAFGVPRTSPINPTTSATGSEVWVVRLADRQITVLPDLLATDLKWSPDGALLAIASGAEQLRAGESLQDGRIHLYAPSSGTMRTLSATLGAGSLTWAPDSRRIAYTVGGVYRAADALRVIDVDTERQQVLSASFEANHGVGPLWSPDGQTIVYQRLCRTNPADQSVCREEHEVVLLTPADPSGEATLSREVVLPMFRTTSGGSGHYLFPSRVTWSPNRDYLLYQAWSEPDDGLPGDFLVAVPTDPEKPSVILADVEGIVAYDGYPDTSYVPIQAWGRQPAS